MLNVLQDIGEAQSMLASTDDTKGGGRKQNKAHATTATAATAPPALPHPIDVNYGLLHTDLKPISPGTHEYEKIK